MYDNEGFEFLGKNYLILQGLRLLPIGAFGLVATVIYGLLWSWAGNWSPWLEIAAFLIFYAAFWAVEEHCDRNYGRTLGSPVDGPPTARARLALAAALTSCLAVGYLAGSPLGGVELAIAGWLLGHQRQGGQLWKHYRFLAWSFVAAGVVTILATLFGVQPPSPWTPAMAGIVIVPCGLADQSLLNRNLEPVPEDDDDD